MKKAKKSLLLVLCALLLVVGSVMGTMAYLTSQDAVTNTFTVGNVTITMDETDTDGDNNTQDNVTVGNVTRDKANAYHLMPGATYVKDPIVHVDASSESCWVFVKVENGLKSYEAAGEASIEYQITRTNQWTVLDAQNGVYYKAYAKGQADKDLEVFSSVTLADTNVQGNDWNAIAGKTITVTAYAIQSEGLADAATAWTALDNQLNS